MTLESLDKLPDEELDAIIAQAEAIKKERDTKRKEKAIEEARAILLRAGLTPQDLAGRRRLSKAAGSKGATRSPVYRGGHHYQHPAKKELVWNAKGQKPAWLRALEAEGGRAIEVPEASAA